MNISVPAELELVGHEYTWSGEDIVKCACPFHHDESPSCAINVRTLRFECYTTHCKQTGDFISFMARLLEVSRAVIQQDYAQKYSLSDDKILDGSIVESAHSRIWSAGGLLEELRLRAVGKELIRKYRLGEQKGRITIPIKNDQGFFVNIRKYLPGAPGKDKMKNMRGHGQIRLFPIDQLSYPKIMITGGEIKAIAAASVLNQHGIGVITTTGGEGNWHHKFTSSIANKKVYLCYDIDEAGQVGARNVAQLIQPFVDWIGIVELGLDIEEHPHGDINDFLFNGGDLHAQVLATSEYVPTTLGNKYDGVEPEDVNLSSAFHASNVAKPIRVPAQVSAIGQAPFSVPCRVKVACDRSQKMCGLCLQVYPHQPDHVYEIEKSSPSILGMVGTTNDSQKKTLKEELQIPESCRVCTFEPVEYITVEEVRLSPKIDLKSTVNEREMLPAVCVGEPVELNQNYDFEGRMYPHPKSATSTLILNSYKVSQDALSTWSPSNIDNLAIFQSDDIALKLNEIYEDLETNVTHIYERRDIHFAVDLAYHSALWIPFRKKSIKGWVEMLIVGDSSQGKTETVEQLRQHYDAGVRIDCKNASVAGLLGGLQQLGNKWFVTWGVLPNNDRRLVILEELKGASTQIIGQLTDMRSSGIAELPKIQRRKTHSRTRLIAISNARSGLDLASYTFGVQSIPELIGSLEDVRRFDAAILVPSSEVDIDQIRECEHRYTRELCQKLILWAWTRTEENIQFESEPFISERAKMLCEKYAEQIPIIDRGSMRFKLARLSTSLAARLFSTNDGETLLVRNNHVEYISEWLERQYSAPAFGYDRYSASLRSNAEIKSPKLILDAINKTAFPMDLVENISHSDDFDIQDIMDWSGFDRQQTGSFISLLVRKRAFTRHKRGYRKSPSFIELIREWLNDGKIIEVPDYVDEEVEF